MRPRRHECRQGFVVKHYAGQVEYSTKGWLDKSLRGVALDRTMEGARLGAARAGGRASVYSYLLVFGVYYSYRVLYIGDVWSIGQEATASSCAICKEQ